MSTIRELVTEAFRENNLIQVGDTPAGAEYTEAEKRLLRIISMLFGAGFGESLVSDVVDYSTKDEGLGANTRVLVTDKTQSTIYLPETPNDGERFSVVDPSGLLSASNLTITPLAGTIEGVDSLTLNTDNIIREWFYRADTGNWVRVTELIDSSQSPFPPEFDDLLIEYLAMRISPRYGTQTAPESAEVYRSMLKMFKARYRQKRETKPEAALSTMDQRSYLYWDRV